MKGSRELTFSERVPQLVVSEISALREDTPRTEAPKKGHRRNSAENGGAP